MKFFIPAARDSAEEQQIYSAVKDFLGKELGAEFSKRQVYKLHYRHNGNTYSAEVGKAEQIGGEIVVAILYEPGRSLYHVCTMNRGVARGMSILVGADEVISSEDFDAKQQQ
jgi:hypothetical protein